MKDKRQPPPVIPVIIPRRFHPLIVEEMAEIGCYTITEVMGRILAEHYDRKAKASLKPTPEPPQAKMEPEITIMEE